MVRNPDPGSNPVPGDPTSPGRTYKRPKATIAAWVLVAIALAEVVVRFLDR
ncbi:MAG: hypothetical protein ACRBK7_17610 [Acidimicrobiales bacterium]